MKHTHHTTAQQAKAHYDSIDGDKSIGSKKGGGFIVSENEPVVESAKKPSVSLTENEVKALEVCLNYGDREAQLCDNFSNGGHKEFKAALGWNNKQVSALIGSLESKGMGYGDDNDGNGHIFWLSEEGVNAIFDIIEARKK
jgi:hypothetical protein